LAARSFGEPQNSQPIADDPSMLRQRILLDDPPEHLYD